MEVEAARKVRDPPRSCFAGVPASCALACFLAAALAVVPALITVLPFLLLAAAALAVVPALVGCGAAAPCPLPLIPAPAATHPAPPSAPSCRFRPDLQILALISEISLVPRVCLPRVELIAELISARI